MGKINKKKIIQKIKKDPNKFYSDYLKINNKVSKSNAIYKGTPVPFLYIPKFFDEKEILTFNKIIENIVYLVNKTVRLYMENEDIRALYNFDPRLDELIRIDHGYKANVPMGRFDIFYYGEGDYKFCELNTDGSSAMNEDMVLGKILSDSLVFKELREQYQINSFELFDTWVKEVQQIAREYGITKEKPTLAIVDFISNEPSVEFEEFQKRFNEKGFNCIIVDPREIEYKEGKMYYNNQVIDIVYRRLVTKDLMERYDEITEFIQGIKANNTCIIGSIKSQIVHTKLFFKILHDPAFQKYLLEEEVEYIEKHIPYTDYLNNPTRDLIEGKDRYIIKPIDNYASKGVYAGKDYSSDQWVKKIENLSGKNYLFQEYCEPAISKNIIFDEGNEVKEKEFKNITGLYSYNEKFYGIYSRSGENAIISGLHECYTLPSFVISKKS